MLCWLTGNATVLMWANIADHVKLINMSKTEIFIVLLQRFYRMISNVLFERKKHIRVVGIQVCDSWPDQQQLHERRPRDLRNRPHVLE